MSTQNTTTTARKITDKIYDAKMLMTRRVGGKPFRVWAAMRDGVKVFTAAPHNGGRGQPSSPSAIWHADISTALGAAAANA